MNASKLSIAQDSITTSSLLAHGWDNMFLNHANNGQMETVLSGEKLPVSAHILILFLDYNTFCQPWAVYLLAVGNAGIRKCA